MSEEDILFNEWLKTIDRVNRATNAVKEASSSKSGLAEAKAELSAAIVELDRLATLLYGFAGEQDRSLQ